jgi:hypothetical protein
MRRVLAFLAVLLIAGIAQWNARCVVDCAAEAKLPPCHRTVSKICVPRMVADRVPVLDLAYVPPVITIEAPEVRVFAAEAESAPPSPNLSPHQNLTLRV